MRYEKADTRKNRVRFFILFFKDSAAPLLFFLAVNRATATMTAVAVGTADTALAALFRFYYISHSSADNEDYGAGYNNISPHINLSNLTGALFGSHALSVFFLFKISIARSAESEITIAQPKITTHALPNLAPVSSVPKK